MIRSPSSLVGTAISNFLRGLQQAQTNPFTKKKMGNEESIKKWGNYSQSKFYLKKNLWLLTKKSKVVRTKDVQYERMDYWTIKVFKKHCRQ